jgi:hypothetical protein
MSASVTFFSAAACFAFDDLGGDLGLGHRGHLHRRRARAPS